MSIKEVKDGVMLEVYVKPKSRKFSIELKDNELDSENVKRAIVNFKG